MSAKNRNLCIFSFIVFILGIVCWIPTLFFYSPDNPPIFIFLTPIVGFIGIIFAIKIEQPKLRALFFVLNSLVTVSLPLSFYLGTLLFRP